MLARISIAKLISDWRYGVSQGMTIPYSFQLSRLLMKNPSAQLPYSWMEQQLSTLRGEPLREELRLGHFKCHFGTSDGEYQNDSDSVHFVRLLMTIYESTDRDLPHLPLSGLIVGSCWFHIPSFLHRSTQEGDHEHIVWWARPKGGPAWRSDEKFGKNAEFEWWSTRLKGTVWKVEW